MHAGENRVSSEAVRRLRSIEMQLQLMEGLSGFSSSDGSLAELKFEAAGIVANSLGSKNQLFLALKDVDTARMASATAWRQESPAQELLGFVRAAIGAVASTTGDFVEPPAPDVCDPDLWDHIQDLVGVESWSKIPSTVVTFTEDWFRRRGGDPRHSAGGKLYGKDLFSKVLDQQPLGGESGEHAGWKMLALGLTQAIGNLHRHNIEQRDDAEQLAWRVIGLASLLIGEMKRVPVRLADHEGRLSRPDLPDVP